MMSATNLFYSILPLVSLFSLCFAATLFLSFVRLVMAWCFC
jgi:hypothetical protein